MKKVFFTVCMLFGVFCFSQNISKKYNSVYKRYEYFAPDGSMIGYEQYNNVLKQWDYYSTNNSQSPQTRQPTQYRDPQQLDISNLGNALNTKQNRYNNNVSKVQTAISRISDHLRNLQIPDERKQNVFGAFENNCMKQMPNINYSSDSQTDSLVQFLYDCVNDQLKNN
jgi:hypothetical protein